MTASNGKAIDGSIALVTGANRGLGRATDQTSIYPDIQKLWDAGDNPWRS